MEKAPPLTKDHAIRDKPAVAATGVVEAVEEEAEEDKAEGGLEAVVAVTDTHSYPLPETC